MKAGGVHSIYPGKQIRKLHREQFAALFLIEKNNCGIGKSFVASCSGCGRGIPCSDLFCARDRAKIFCELSIRKDQKTKTCSFQFFALAQPSGSALTWRRREPVTGVGESFFQLGKRVRSGIIVAVEAEIELRRSGGGCRSALGGGR